MDMTTAVFLGMGAVVLYGLGALGLAMFVSGRKKTRDESHTTKAAH